MIEGRDDDVGPAAHVLDQRFFPSASLHLEHHLGAAGEAGEVRKTLDRGAALDALRGRERLHDGAVQLIVVKENGRVVGEKTEIGFEAVRARAQSLFEGGQRVLRKALWSATMTEDQEAGGARNLLSPRH